MRFKWTWVLLLAAAVGTGCGDGDEEEGRPQAQRPTTQRDSVVRQPVYPEAEAAQILRAINAGGIATSRVARERSQNDDILRYASVMIADHAGMTTLLDSILPPISDSVNAVSRTIAQESTLLVDSMQRLEGGFNNTYIQAQIAQHERALLLLDTALIPSARNPKLKQLLQDLRPAVVAHLQRAHQIWAARQASGMAAATAARPRPTTTAPTTTPGLEPTPTAPPPVPADTQTPPPPTTTTNNM
ncbi:MAG TPA: DUF4142 domain-containing protein [Longimicrobiales bacterium]|nr:DUF4142 domain-containing protein [Longimicrobiales bacterium]